ncbi:hypothetical protein [Telmatospirillum sp. J64-1]|uniref:hypothetical protein n=1 Tax=Telmatospirillum sp. J64-1 TaxID=2502183 RepID=UPI00115CBBC7|nr:hypothetical protein [Telmatospirillum sp. J64-1]
MQDKPSHEFLELSEHYPATNAGPFEVVATILGMHRSCLDAEDKAATLAKSLRDAGISCMIEIRDRATGDCRREEMVLGVRKE